MILHILWKLHLFLTLLLQDDCSLQCLCLRSHGNSDIKKKKDILLEFLPLKASEYSLTCFFLFFFFLSITREKRKIWIHAFLKGICAKVKTTKKETLLAWMILTWWGTYLPDVHLVSGYIFRVNAGWLRLPLPIGFLAVVICHQGGGANRMLLLKIKQCIWLIHNGK